MKKKNNSGLIMMLIILGILIAVASFFVYTAFNSPKHRNSTNADIPPMEAHATYKAEQEVVAIAPKSDSVDKINAVLPSVVGVSVYKTDNETMFEQGNGAKTGVTSGVIVSESGYIVTNRHILGNAEKNIQVSLSNGKVVFGDVKWSDPALDIAIIKIEERGITPMALGDVKECKIGQEVYAVGNPAGLQFQRIVTKGIISAIYRTLSAEGENGETILMEDLLQTDMHIGQENIGGPLINQDGEVIGINTDKLTNAENAGFAVPINIIKPIIKSLEDTGDFKAPYFGIFAYDREVAEYLTQNFDKKVGIYIVKVDENSPAYNIGIRANDTITHVNSKEINTMMDFRSEIYAWNSDSPIGITFITNGVVKEASVLLERKR